MTNEKLAAYMRGLMFTGVTLAEQVRRLPAKPGVYRVFCLLAGKVYVGQSVNVRERVRNHVHALLGDGVGENRALLADVRARGKRSLAVELVRTCDEWQLDLEERRAIADVPEDMRYNIMPGGRSGYTVPEWLKTAMGENRSALTPADRQLAAAMVSTGTTVAEVADVLGVGEGSVRSAVKGVDDTWI